MQFSLLRMGSPCSKFRIEPVKLSSLVFIMHKNILYVFFSSTVKEFNFSFWSYCTDDEANCDNRLGPKPMGDEDSSNFDSHFSVVRNETSEENLGNGKIDNLNANLGNEESAEGWYKLMMV
ncbi:hypothetical protein V6N12_067846 [Hibiscus sabdariffa]|uniref:Uncharacterized protein n=1 Tax=Hibiscus sabdariffa TaxID=183260 RepID=A0ABR2FNW2_9ROSI